MKFGSWTYDGYSLDLRLSTEDGGDLSSYISSGEWILVGESNQLGFEFGQRITNRSKLDLISGIVTTICC